MESALSRAHRMFDVGVNTDEAAHSKTQLLPTFSFTCVQVCVRPNHSLQMVIICRRAVPASERYLPRLAETCNLGCACTTPMQSHLGSTVSESCVAVTKH